MDERSNGTVVVRFEIGCHRGTENTGKNTWLTLCSLWLCGKMHHYQRIARRVAMLEIPRPAVDRRSATCQDDLRIAGGNRSAIVGRDRVVRRNPFANGCKRCAVTRAPFAPESKPRATRRKASRVPARLSAIIWKLPAAACRLSATNRGMARTILKPPGFIRGLSAVVWKLSGIVWNPAGIIRGLPVAR